MGLRIIGGETGNKPGFAFNVVAALQATVAKGMVVALDTGANYTIKAAVNDTIPLGIVVAVAADKKTCTVEPFGPYTAIRNFAVNADGDATLGSHIWSNGTGNNVENEATGYGIVVGRFATAKTVDVLI
jgi:hypothetical protein